MERLGSFPGGPTGNSETPQIGASPSLAYPRGAKTISEFPSRGLGSQVNVRTPDFTSSRHQEPGPGEIRMRNYRRSEIILVLVTRLYVLGVNSSASVAIGTRATSTPRRACDMRRTVPHAV